MKGRKNCSHELLSILKVFKMNLLSYVYECYVSMWEQDVENPLILEA